jgi:hypothetical protein
MTTASSYSIAGDIGASSGGPDGLFKCDTRYLSHFELLINGLHTLHL